MIAGRLPDIVSILPRWVAESGGMNADPAR